MYALDIQSIYRTEINGFVGWFKVAITIRYITSLRIAIPRKMRIGNLLGYLQRIIISNLGLSNFYLLSFPASLLGRQVLEGSSHTEPKQRDLWNSAQRTTEGGFHRASVFPVACRRELGFAIGNEPTRRRFIRLEDPNQR